jgi:cell division protein ZapE
MLASCAAAAATSALLRHVAAFTARECATGPVHRLHRARRHFSSIAPSPSPIRHRLEEARRAGILRPDAAQEGAADALDAAFRRAVKFAQQRAAYVPPPQTSTSPSTTTHAVTSPPPPLDPLAPPPDVRAVGSVPRGLYLWGSVGTGKTMLMDWAYDAVREATTTAAVPPSSPPSPPLRIPTRRIHFHAFMLEVHSRVHAWKQAQLVREGRGRRVDLRPERDALHHVAKALAAEAWVLCLDEVQVTDVADAMILTRLFTTLFRDGVLLLATSNRPPEDLYAGGLNREYVLPFLASLRAHARVHEVGGVLDHRTHGSTRKEGRFLHPLNAATASAVSEAVWGMVRAAAGGGGGGGGAKTGGPLLPAPQQDTSTPSTQPAVNPVTGDGDLPGMPPLARVSLPVAMGRTLHVRSPCAGVAVSSFVDLCSRPLGAADYASLARAFPTVVLLGVPRLTRVRHNDARRFITLVDELYEARAEVLLTSACAAERLFDPLLRSERAAAAARVRVPAGTPTRPPAAGVGLAAAGTVGTAVRPHPADASVLDAGTAYGDGATPVAAEAAPLLLDPAAEGEDGEREVEEVEEDEDEEVELEDDDGEGNGSGGARETRRQAPSAGAAADSTSSASASTSTSTGPATQPVFVAGAASVVTSAAERAAMGELAFACRRALSRLTEMTSTAYAGKETTSAARERAGHAARGVTG